MVTASNGRQISTLCSERMLLVQTKTRYLYLLQFVLSKLSFVWLLLMLDFVFQSMLVKKIVMLPPIWLERVFSQSREKDKSLKKRRKKKNTLLSRKRWLMRTWMAMIRMESLMTRMDTILELKEAAVGMQLVVVTVLTKLRMTQWRILLVANLDQTFKREFKPHLRTRILQV